MVCFRAPLFSGAQLPRQGDRRRRFAQVAAAGLLLTGLLGTGSASPAALGATLRTAVPIGAGYDSVTLQRFASAAAAHDSSGDVRIVVFDFTYGVDPYTITNGLRQKNATLADARRAQIEAACDAVKAAAQTCTAILDDVQVRSEAFEPPALEPFAPDTVTADVDGLYVLGGDQDVGMLVVGNTPLEAAMAEAYANGAVLSGNSAGAAVESTNMIAGYTGNNGPENGFERDSVLLWLNDGPNDSERGLSFGLPGVLLDQHVAQRGRIARLVNASFTTQLLGIGVDASTAAAIENETALTDVTGRTISFVADPFTYGATGRFAGPRDSLAVHGLATHVLAQGGDGYAIDARQPTLGGVAEPAPPISGRTFGFAFSLPAGAAPLLLGGGLTADRAGIAAQRFVELAGGRGDAHLVVLASGYARSNDAAAEAKAEAAALQALVDAPVARFVLDTKADEPAVLAALSGATGIWLTAPDQSRVTAALAARPAITSAVHDRWVSGASALLLDNAAAAAIGPSMTADATPPSDTSGLEEASSVDFLVDGVTLAPGLGWLSDVSVEPRLLPDRHWGRLYNLLRAAPGRLAVGVDVGTAVELGSSGPVARGSSTVVVLDGRYGSFGIGSNGAVSARWVLLDSYVDGDAVAP
jgi:cyanophycinase